MKKTKYLFFIIPFVLVVALGTWLINIDSFGNRSIVNSADASSLYSADINSDGIVDIFDLSILLSQWGFVANYPAVWIGDFENGDFSQFDVTSWNNLPSAPELSSSIVRSGSYSGIYNIPSGGSRSENVPKTPAFNRGDDYWFSWSTYLENVPLNTSEWQVITQWKNDGIGSPPLSLAIEQGVFKITGGWGWPGDTENISPKLDAQNIGPAQNGVWEDWKMHIYFHDDPNIGYFDLWRNGTQVISQRKMPGGTLYPGVNGNGLSSYLKIGYYRSTNISDNSNVYHDNWKVGTTEESVN